MLIMVAFVPTAAMLQDIQCFSPHTITYFSVIICIFGFSKDDDDSNCSLDYYKRWAKFFVARHGTSRIASSGCQRQFLKLNDMENCPLGESDTAGDPRGENRPRLRCALWPPEVRKAPSSTTCSCCLRATLGWNSSQDFFFFLPSRWIWTIMKYGVVLFTDSLAV